MGVGAVVVVATLSLPHHPQLGFEHRTSVALVTMGQAQRGHSAMGVWDLLEVVPDSPTVVL